MARGNLGERKGNGLRLTALGLALALLTQSLPAAAAPVAAPFAAAYQATVAATVGAGTDLQLPVTVTNTGDQAWDSWGPPQMGPGLGQVSISYHWYDAAGNVLVWDGIRSGLAPATRTTAEFVVAPGATVSATATIRVPQQVGTYVLRLAMVNDGVAWMEPSQAYTVQAVPAFSAAITAPALPSLVSGHTYTLPVTLANQGVAAWSSTGANPVHLSYHWLDASGAAAVWDGERTALPDIAPGGTQTVKMRVATPEAAGEYTLVIDLVREGVAWFETLGNQAPRVEATVAPVIYGASYSVGASISAYFGETKAIPVTITNTGNVPWNEENPVNLAYHVFDPSGAAVVWDGQRTPIGELLPGQSRSVELTYQVPSILGQFTLAIDAVREGVAWFSNVGVPTASLPLNVTSGFEVGYGATTTPALATIGATVRLDVLIDNYGPRTLEATGPNQARLSYHIYDSAGQLVVWDGQRGLLPFTVPAGASAKVTIDVQLPARTGDYAIEWDVVQEGVAWLSHFGIASKREAITVQPGVTFYGKGNGHGLGMSQYGAQGMATGAVGPQRTGEEIVAYYYPGTTLLPIDNSRQIRVLLSQPSSTRRYSCGAAFFDGSVGTIVSGGGLAVFDEGSGSQLIFQSQPAAGLRFIASGGVLQVIDVNSGAQVYAGPGPILTVPIDPAHPTDFLEKGIYRGTMRFTNLGGTLRVVNTVDFDTYVKAVVPLEMLKNWHLEAYKAQALAARTYAYNSWVGERRDYDVHDDQSDQCYGGVQMRSGRVVETEITNLAVDLTAGKVITQNGAAIRAYFAASNGGFSKPVGCWGFNVVLSGPSVSCSESPSYLTAVPDPWDLSVSVPAPNPRASVWTRTFTSAQVRDAILTYRGIDIGTLLSVDLSNRVPADVGHVVSVKIVGTNGTWDLPADRLLRDHLFLPSTMVRLGPW